VSYALMLIAISKHLAGSRRPPQMQRQSIDPFGMAQGRPERMSEDDRRTRKAWRT